MKQFHKSPYAKTWQSSALEERLAEGQYEAALASFNYRETLLRAAEQARLNAVRAAEHGIWLLDRADAIRAAVDAQATEALVWAGVGFVLVFGVQLASALGF